MCKYLWYVVDLESFWCILRSRIAGTYGSATFRTLRLVRTDFCSGYIYNSSHSYPQWIGLLFISLPIFDAVCLLSFSCLLSFLFFYLFFNFYLFWSYCIALAGLETQYQTGLPLPAPASWVLGSRACAATPYVMVLVMITIQTWMKWNREAVLIGISLLAMAVNTSSLPAVCIYSFEFFLVFSL